MRAHFRRITRQFGLAEWWVGRCLAYATRGIVSRSQNWAIAGAGVVGFVSDIAGLKMTPLEGYQGALASAAAGVIAAWILLFVLRLFIAPFRMWSHGKWYGDEFVYNEPPLAFHERISPENNNFVHNFRFPEAPPYSFIKYKIECDGRREFISIMVAAHWRQLPVFSDHKQCQYTSGGIRVGRDRKMVLTTFMRADATPFSIRIKVAGWERPNKQVLQDPHV